jgi:SHS2 domain-containing protein
MNPFELINHTADIGIRARGATLIELFENSAKGMFHIIGGNAKIETSASLEKNIEIKRTIDAFEELLVAWLSELLYIFNKEKVYFNNFEIKSMNNYGIIAIAKGVKIDSRQAGVCKEIKAVTFHNLKIEEAVSGFSCDIIFDV